MNPEDRKFLQDNSIKLSENCNFDNVLEYMKLKQIFTQKQLDHYQTENFRRLGEEQKCQKLFMDLQTRGPCAFSCLQECFRDTGQHSQYQLMTRGRQGHLDTLEHLPQEAVQVKKSKVLIEGEDVYEMSSSPRGKFIFINNETFHGMENRTGAHWDEDFQDYLSNMGYRGVYFKNKTTQEMRSLLQEFAVDRSLAKVDSCIIIIGSHGGVTDSKELFIHGCDFGPPNPLLCDEIINLFNSDICTLRRGCPKIFIFQACRVNIFCGSKFLLRLSAIHVVPLILFCRGKGTVVKGELKDRSEVKRTSKPWEDTFLLAPCVEGLQANRWSNCGTWLLLALKDIFKNHAHNLDLGSMKNLITDKFDEYFKDSVPALHQTLAYYEYGVSKKLYFNPGVYKKQEMNY